MFEILEKKKKVLFFFSPMHNLTRIVSRYPIGMLPSCNLTTSNICKCTLMCRQVLPNYFPGRY